MLRFSPLRRKRRLATEDGQTVVEFIFVMPWLIALLFIIIDFALVMNYNSDLNHIAAETARRAAVNQDAGFNPQTYAVDAAESGLRDGDHNLAVSVCLPGGVTPGNDGVVMVKATADFDLLQVIPGLPDIATVDISGRAAMRLETPATFSGDASSTNCD